MTHKSSYNGECNNNNFLGPDLASFERHIVNLDRYIEKNDTAGKKIAIDENNTKEHKSKEKSFVFDLPKEHEILKGRIKREKNGSNNVYYYEHETLGLEYYKVLMIEMKQSEMLIYDVRNNDVVEVAKIKKNMIGSVYKLLVQEKEKWVFKYECSLNYSRSPRKFTIIGHSLRYNLYQHKCKKALSKMIKNEEWEDLLIFVNKPPQYNSDSSTFMLNLQERETNPSVRNFQIIDFFDTNDAIMTFGKQTVDVFVVEFCYPVSIIDAFFFSLCSVDSKSWLY
ncbi:hypothetical protein BDAP_001253 [Binucleata daphniae]